MRWLLALLLLAPTATALMEDPEGDVRANHCGAADTPLTGFESMDLRSLSITETPFHINLAVETTGLAREANYDSGNYFVWLRHDDIQYVVRMYQDNAGTGAIADVLLSPDGSVFGQLYATVAASVQGATIYAEIPKNNLRGELGAWPHTGKALEDIRVSAQAHATGVYGCPDSTGPVIIRDDMGADAWARFETHYGGVTIDGPVAYAVDLPFRASNGEATTYAFNQRITNLADGPRTFTFEADLPAGWTAYPAADLSLEAGAEGQAITYVQVPFVHVHGATEQGSLTIRSDDATATGEIGVHYLAIAQPSGHHPNIYLHSLAAMGVGTQFNAAAGGGDNILYWNTVEDDPSDHGLPISSQTDSADLVWWGCLSPDLRLGLLPDRNATGQFRLNFDATLPTTGTLTGAIHLVPDSDRPLICHDTSGWEMEPLLELEATPVDLNGPITVEGAVRAVFDEARPHQPGSDLLLELRITPDNTPIAGGTVDLLPGSSMRLPLLDYHEPAPVVPDEVRNATATPADAASEAAAAAGLFWVVPALALVRRLK